MSQPTRNTTPPCPLGLSRATLSAWHDGELPTPEMQRIARHVITCAACQQRLDQFARIAAALQQQSTPDLRRQTWRGLQVHLSQKELQPMPLRRFAAFSGLGAVAFLVVLVVVLGLVLHQRVAGTTSPVAATTATATSPAVNTITPGNPTSTPSPTSCASALPGAGPATAGPNFTDLPLPPNSVSTALTRTGGGGDGQFMLYTLELCTSGSDPSAINTFFNGLTASQWLRSNTFPTDGSYQSSCGNAICWAKDVRYINLPQPITVLGGGTERYHLILATAPPAPNCNGSGSTFSTGYYYLIPDPGYTATQVFANIPLPPLSRIVPNDASGGKRGYDICSAGTVASISDFMYAHLMSLGWTPAPAGNGTLIKDKYILTISVPSATDWNIHWTDPSFQP